MALGTDTNSRVKYSGSSFIIIGDNGRVLTSPDGIYWTGRTSGIFKDLYDCCYNPDDHIWLIVGDDGSAARSFDDGATWSSLTIGGGNDDNFLCAYGMGIYCVYSTQWGGQNKKLWYFHGDSSYVQESSNSPTKKWTMMEFMPDGRFLCAFENNSQDAVLADWSPLHYNLETHFTTGDLAWQVTVPAWVKT